QGNSINSGLSSNSTWDLSTVNSYGGKFKAGDSILFKCGDTFRGTLKIQNYNTTVAGRLIFSSYGKGAKPVIKGSSMISNWVSIGNNLWRADYAKNAKHLFRNNKVITVARFPNNNALSYTTSPGTKASFRDSTMIKPAGFFNAATVHIHSINWQWEKRTVKSQDAKGLITFSSDCQYAAEKGWGYYFDNKYEFLDVENEWFCDTIAKKVYLVSSTDPNLSLIETPSVKYTVEISWGINNIVVDNLDIRQAENINLYVGNSINCIISNNNISQGLDTGILSFYGKDNIVKNNTIEDILGTGLTWGAENSTIIYNKVRRIGMIPGYGTTGYGDNGMNTSKFSYVAYNTIDSIANLGLGIGQGSVGEYNIVNCACLVMNDCGGLAVPFGKDGGKNISLNYNIISNVTGGTYGTPAGNPPIGNGIYYGGDNDSNITTFRNIVYNCNGIGISMLDTWYSMAKENVLYNNANGISNIVLDLGSIHPQNNNTITGNIIYGLSPSQKLYKFQNNVADIMPSNFNQSDNNYLYNPYSDIVFETQVFRNGGYPSIEYSLNRLINERKHDLASKKHFEKLSGFKSITVTGANLVANGTFDANINGWGCNQNFYSQFKWVNTQTLLNAGSLVVANNPNQYSQPLCAFKIGNNTRTQWYRLRFSCVSDKPNYIEVNISNNFSPWNGITQVKKIAVEKFKTENEYFFQLPQGAVDARIGFRIPGETSNIYTIWLDNVYLEPVTIVADVAPQIHSPIFVNSSTTDQTYFLNGKYYKDLDGNDVCGGSITLKPFTAKILVLQDGSTCGVAAQEAYREVESNFITVSPNPVVKNNHVHFNKAISFELFDILGKYVASHKEVTEMNTSDLNPQIYILKLDSSQTLKLLVQ
ncbi:MAG TPA: T9SS type A sorting domain-containing protein, partial [Cytophagaceae bacterium]